MMIMAMIFLTMKTLWTSSNDDGYGAVDEADKRGIKIVMDLKL